MPACGSLPRPAVFFTGAIERTSDQDVRPERAAGILRSLWPEPSEGSLFPLLALLVRYNKRMLELRRGAMCAPESYLFSSGHPRLYPAVTKPYLRPSVGSTGLWSARHAADTKPHEMILLRDVTKQTIWNDTLANRTEHLLWNVTLVNSGYLLLNDTLANSMRPQTLWNDTLVKKGGGTPLAPAKPHLQPEVLLPSTVEQGFGQGLPQL